MVCVDVSVWWCVVCGVWCGVLEVCWWCVFMESLDESASYCVVLKSQAAMATTTAATNKQTNKGSFVRC